MCLRQIAHATHFAIVCVCFFPFIAIANVVVVVDVGDVVFFVVAVITAERNFDFD